MTEEEELVASLFHERILKKGSILKLKGQQKADFENEFNRMKQVCGLTNWPAHTEIYKDIILYFLAWGREHLELIENKK